MPKKESGEPAEGEVSLETRIAKPVNTPTNAKDQLAKVKKYSAVLQDTVSHHAELEEMGAEMGAEADQAEAEKDIEQAKEALKREAKKCAEFMISEWPTDDQIEKSRSELKQIEDNLKPIEERLQQLNQVPDKKFPGFDSIKGLTIQLERRNNTLADWEKMHKTTAPKAEEMKQLMAQSQEMGALRRTFSGINGKIADLRHSSVEGPIKDAEKELATIASLKKDVNELTTQLEAMQDEAKPLAVQQIKLREERESIERPVEDLRKRALELLMIIRKLEPGVVAVNSLENNKAVLSAFLESK